VTDGRCVDYRFAPHLCIRICSGRGPRRHFAAEYAGTEVRSGGTAGVEIRFDDDGGRAAARIVCGGYKTVSWVIGLPDAADDVLRASVDLRGWPRSFVLSLVQGFYVEPLLSVAAARKGTVLLPSAGIGERDGALLLLGRSRSGKSTLAARALAGGRPLLGDDQVLIDPAGLCRPFPRRLRFYADLRHTAPTAYGRLAAPARAGLFGRAIVASLTRNYVAPPIRIPPAALGQPGLPRPLPIARVVLVERSDEPSLEHSDLRLDDAVASAGEILDEQRTYLRDGGGSGWRAALEEIRRREGEIVAAAWSRTSLSRLRVPRAWTAAEAIPRLARELGLDRTS
jgi:hypothetical protein